MRNMWNALRSHIRYEGFFSGIIGYCREDLPDDLRRHGGVWWRDTKEVFEMIWDVCSEMPKAFFEGLIHFWTGKAPRPVYVVQVVLLGVALGMVASLEGIDSQLEVLFFWKNWEEKSAYVIMFGELAMINLMWSLYNIIRPCQTKNDKDKTS